jgi:hypothetical protein
MQSGNKPPGPLRRRLGRRIGLCVDARGLRLGRRGRVFGHVGGAAVGGGVWKGDGGHGRGGRGGGRRRRGGCPVRVV